MVNQKAAAGGLNVRRRKIMRWPGHGMDGLSAASVADRTAPALVVHWAGMKKSRFGDMTGADLLKFFEKRYFQRLPAGSVRRFVTGPRHILSERLRGIRVRARMTLHRVAAPPLRRM
jgi:hypothetical protein